MKNSEQTFFSQDGDAELGTVAAGCWECVVTELLSALVLWTETRREERTEPPAGHAGHCELFSLMAPHRQFVCLLTAMFWSLLQVVEGFPHDEVPCSVLGCAEESPFTKIHRMKGFLVSFADVELLMSCWWVIR